MPKKRKGTGSAFRKNAKRQKRSGSYKVNAAARRTYRRRASRAKRSKK